VEAALEPFLHVLVIDELGYLSHATDAANVLYRVVNERYLKHRPILLTTNKPVAVLGDVLHDGDLAEAILDRLLERGGCLAAKCDAQFGQRVGTGRVVPRLMSVRIELHREVGLVGDDRHVMANRPWCALSFLSNGRACSSVGVVGRL
jgi:hypothetical protein